MPDFVVCVAAGDREVIVVLLLRYRTRLRRSIRLRFDMSLQGRIDASDVTSEWYPKAIRRLDKYIGDPCRSTTDRGVSGQRGGIQSTLSSQARRRGPCARSNGRRPPTAWPRLTGRSCCCATTSR